MPNEEINLIEFQAKDSKRSGQVRKIRQALHDILAEQEKRRMVASSNLPFAAEPFGAPTVSVKATSPRPLLLIFTSLVLGIVLGVAIALSLHQADRRTRLAT